VHLQFAECILEVVGGGLFGNYQHLADAPI